MSAPARFQKSCMLLTDQVVDFERSRLRFENQNTEKRQKKNAITKRILKTWKREKYVWSLSRTIRILLSISASESELELNVSQLHYTVQKSKGYLQMLLKALNLVVVHKIYWVKESGSLLRIQTIRYNLKCLLYPFSCLYATRQWCRPAIKPILSEWWQKIVPYSLSYCQII